MNNWHWIGFLLAIVGVSYLRRPNMFRRGIWLRTSIAIRTMSPETYVKYIRGLDVLFIVLGVASFVYGFVAGAF